MPGVVPLLVEYNYNTTPLPPPHPRQQTPPKKNVGPTPAHCSHTTALPSRPITLLCASGELTMNNMTEGSDEIDAVDLLTSLSQGSKLRDSRDIFHEDEGEEGSGSQTPLSSDLSSDAVADEQSVMTSQHGLKRKRELQNKIKTVGFDKFVQDSCRQTYYMCKPGGDNGILKCVPTWSIHKNCKHDALMKVLKYYPLMDSIISSSGCSVGNRPPGTSEREWFIENYAKMSHSAMNGARSNLTRAMKRNFFQPGMTAATRQQPPDPHCILWGPFQLAKGCLKNEQNVAVGLISFSVSKCTC